MGHRASVLRCRADPEAVTCVLAASDDLDAEPPFLRVAVTVDGAAGHTLEDDDLLYAGNALTFTLPRARLGLTPGIHTVEVRVWCCKGVSLGEAACTVRC